MELIEELTKVRSNPRLMHESSLRKSGLFTRIMEITADDSFNAFKLKERIDYILSGCVDTYCYCGNRTKPNAKYCSGACTGNAPSTKAIISEKQRSNAADRMEKSRQTMLDRYGITHNNQLDSCKASRKAKRIIRAEETRRETFARYGLNIDDFSTKEAVVPLIEDCVSFNHLRVKHFGGMPAMTLFRYLRDKLGIEHFYDKTSSGSERELREFLIQLGVDDLVYNSRTILGNGREVDIYSPSHKIGIEFHGLYWHAGLENKHLHREKFEAAQSAGIDLIQVFEDEWFYKQEIVKSIISSKFGITKKVHARKCKVQFVDSKTAAAFLDENHLQGRIAGKHVGLYDCDRLVSLVTIGRSRFRAKDAAFELLRYASAINTTVVGGFSKLMKFVRSNITTEPILTYCDLRYSNGNTYKKFGHYIRTTEPGYFWANFNKCYRLSRHETQKSKLAALIGAAYDQEKTERENMEASQHALIWDCGHAVYLLE